MHKILTFLLLFLIFSYGKSQNKIDSIKTVEDIQKLIDDKRITEFMEVVETLPFEGKYQKLADSLGVKPWIKADFDNDGRTDILINGILKDEIKTICILDKGTNYETHKINKGKLFEVASFTTVEKNKIIFYNYKILNKYGFISNLQKTKLVYKFGGFIEENINPKYHNILEINFSSGGSYDPKESLSMKIISNRDIEFYSTKNYLDESKGKIYKGKVNESDYKALIELLNYIDFENLNEDYVVGFSDTSTARLNIIYDKSLTKSIYDYGHSGTRGLERLYKHLNQIIIKHNSKQ